MRDHVEVVLERINANTEATTQNGTHRRLIEACDKLGYEHRPIWRNASLDDDPANCGYCPAGCQHGCKRSAMKTWLQDCSDAGGRAVVGAHADRILTDDGRATGVEATVTHEDGTTTALRVDAPTVVVACGSVESPALLLRSGIGGPAVGKNLRLHPAYVVMGVYDEPVEGWSGQIQSALSDHFFDVEDGCGFLIEATGMFPGLLGRLVPVGIGRGLEAHMQSLRWQAPFITVARDHGSGEVVLDEHGRAVVRWGLDDEVDARLARRANVELARLHQAAGAVEIFTGHSRAVRWRHGEDFDEYLERVDRRELRAERRRLLHRPPDGLLPDGLGPGDVGRRRRRAAARRQGRLDRRRERVPDRARRQPDGDDHVARAPDRRQAAGRRP